MTSCLDFLFYDTPAMVKMYAALVAQYDTRTLLYEVRKVCVCMHVCVCACVRVCMNVPVCAHARVRQHTDNLGKIWQVGFAVLQSNEVCS